MNRRKIGAKITKIANLTFQQISCNSSEENNNIINNNGKNNNLENNNASLCIDLDKGKKRLPLGEVKIINTTGETCVPIEKTLSNQLLSKKRTERFEVCLDNEEIDNDENKKKTINSDIKKRRDLSENEDNDKFNKLNENSRFELLSPLPGKENVMPIKTPTKQDEKEYLTHFDTESISSYNTVPELITPSECLTAKSSFSIPQLKGQLTINDPLQTHINAEMRAILIDWFVDVIVELELSPASFFLAVSLTDRTLSVVDCPKERLQLLGATAVLISTKVQEVFPPLVKDIVFVTDDSYSENQVRKMEKVILRVADFQLNLPLIDSFAQLFDHTAVTSAFPLNQVARNLMWYFLELSTFDCFSVHILQSRLAAAAFLLASSFQKIRQKIEPIATIDKDKLWSDEMVKRTKIKRSNLEEPGKFE
uniref:CYCLIN domain-containing protein n=1 Tax=Meloidogyne hapla TaxID=6305 RepID=A0A1I8BAM8_MELHA